jgi:hypothetical protein
MLNHREISSRSDRLRACLARCRSGRTDAAGWGNRKDRRGLPIKPAPDRTHRLPSLPPIPIPDLRPLGCRVINATSLFHVHTPSLINN